MKFKNLVFFLILSVFAANAAEYLAETYPQKMKVPLQMFKITFDRLVIDSDYSFGSSKHTGIPDTNLALRGLIGFDGKNAYRAEPGEDLKFPAIRNVDPHKGTMVFWTAGLDHAPGAKLTNGKPRGNNCLSELRFGNGKEHITIRVYECDGILAAIWENSLPPKNSYAVVEKELDFDRGQWYQVMVTWSPEELVLYVNGKSCARCALPAKSKETANLKMTADDSFIGIRSLFYEDKHKWGVGMDDYAILSRPLSPLEAANFYRKVCKGKSDAHQVFSVGFNGVDTGTGKIDRVEAVYDLSGLSDAEIADLKAGKLPVECTLTDPEGKSIFSGKIDLRKVRGSHIFDKVDRAGKYTLKMKVGKHAGEYSVVRPDYSFVGNGIGEADTVPAPWKDFAVDGRKVTLWNRVYQFGAGPLPERIDAYGKPLLKQPPVIDIDGKKIRWTAGPTRRKNTSVTFTGKGEAEGLAIDYETTVAFDGLIDLAYTISGKPEIGRMEISWQMIPEASEFLLVPKLQTPGKHSFPWPLSRENNQIFMAGEGKGGFCWCAENDANWVYGKGEHVLFADTATGKCSIRMITRKVTVPEKTRYTSLFIATPVRPITQKKRFNTCESYAAGKFPGSVSFIGADQTSGAFMRVFDIRLGKNCDRWFKKLKDKSVMPYNASDQGSEVMPEALYLRKYTEKPGAYSYRMQYWRVQPDGKLKKEYQNSIAVCNGTWINDFLMRNNKALLEDKKYGRTIGKLFYDLASNDLCCNPYHGCLFFDNFGREIRTFVVLKKRKLFERTVRFLEPYGLPLQLHSQRFFNPVLHGMCDFWEPGEQHCAMLAKDPFGWIDGKVEEPFFRSEYNRDVLGTGIIVNSSIAQLNYKHYQNSKAAIAFITMMLLYDIDFSGMWMCAWPAQKLWGILKSYDFGAKSVSAHKFYQQKEVKSSDPDLPVTWYGLPGGRILMAVGNRTGAARKTEIDMSVLYNGTTRGRDDYLDRNVEITNGKFSVEVPPQAFALIVTPQGILDPKFR